MHDMEHYGNLVTYMRLKNIVPPTSEQPPAAQQKSNHVITESPEQRRDKGAIHRLVIDGLRAFLRTIRTERITPSNNCGRSASVHMRKKSI